MPVSHRLSLSRGRQPSSGAINTQQLPKKSTSNDVQLSDLIMENEWEPCIDEEPETLEQLRQHMIDWEHALASRGRPVSGRTIVVVHSLPYVCTLHPTKSHSLGFDDLVMPAANPDDSLVSSGAQTPLEITPGDPLLRLRALHSPTTSMHSQPPISFSSPTGSLQPSRHPPCPPSRSGSPDIDQQSVSRTGTPAQLHAQSHRWVLHPRRGHAALNSGLRSLSGRALTVVGRPDDLNKAGGKAITQGELSPSAKRDLENGLMNMAGEKGQGIGCVPVWLDDQIHTRFYEGMCKEYLWPVFHYLPLPDSMDKAKETSAWNAYYETNLVYAKKVAETYRQGDLIWIHDYHLLLVPQMLRKLLPEASLYISLFLHCPFPSSEYFRCLPRKEELLDGMLGCNLVVFQTHSYARHFLSSCVRVMGYEAGPGGVDAKGKITRIAHCPIGIDVDNVEQDSRAPGVGPKMEALRRMYEGKKIIVGRDKLDPTKGVLPKLRAFERFLSMFPEWAHKVVLIQVTSPSPGDSPALATKVSELVDHINAQYGSLEFQPVHHYHQTVERDEYFALLTIADVALVTSLRDGMNTTAMEYTICQAERKGCLIVSEFTGVSSTLSKAIRVNPWDLGGVARAIDQCLRMPFEERSARQDALYESVRHQTAAVWAATNILKLLESLQGEQASQNTPRLDTAAVLTKYKTANKRLLLFDYDGTLTPIVKNPQDALPSPKLIEALKTLCADRNNVVYIISGRDGDFLREQLGHIPNLGMSAEHGCFIRGPGAPKWTSLIDSLSMDWKTDVLSIFKYYEARTQGAFVEEKISSVTFHYRNADPVFGLFQAKELQAMLESMQESLPIDVLVGKKNVEVRPAHTNKGEIVHRLLYLYPDTEFVMCAGDDKTDEDMFHSLAQVLSQINPSVMPLPSPNAASTPPARPTLQPPDSLILFPHLTNELIETTGSTSSSLMKGDSHAGVSTNEEGKAVLEPVETKLDPSATWMIAIEAKETSKERMTMANAVLNSAQELVDLLAEIASSSKGAH